MAAEDAAVVVDPERYEIQILIGPCSEDEREALMCLLADLPEVRAVHGAVASTRWREDVSNDSSEGMTTGAAYVAPHYTRGPFV